jgi:hypothetical protein
VEQGQKDSQSDPKSREFHEQTPRVQPTIRLPESTFKGKPTPDNDCLGHEASLDSHKYVIYLL